MRRLVSSDKACHLLYLLGWSTGDTAYLDDRDRKVWMVYLHRDEQRISVHARSKMVAWNEALRQAGRVERGL